MKFLFFYKIGNFLFAKKLSCKFLPSLKNGEKVAEIQSFSRYLWKFSWLTNGDNFSSPVNICCWDLYLGLIDLFQRSNLVYYIMRTGALFLTIIILFRNKAPVLMIKYVFDHYFLEFNQVQIQWCINDVTWKSTLVIID